MLGIQGMIPQKTPFKIEIGLCWDGWVKQTNIETNEQTNKQTNIKTKQ